jgi:hypothetical protein
MAFIASPATTFVDAGVGRSTVGLPQFEHGKVLGAGLTCPGARLLQFQPWNVLATTQTAGEKVR